MKKSKRLTVSFHSLYNGKDYVFKKRRKTMKYIRTKDGIEKLDADREHLAEYMNGKKADTIEELCDAFVYAKCDYMTLDEALHEKEWNESDWQQDGLPIHGAIWTDKGLIYVAKMNEKGELELL